MTNKLCTVQVSKSKSFKGWISKPSCVLASFSQLASKTKTSNWFPMFPLNSLNSSLSDPSASGRCNSSSNPLRMCSLLQVTPQVRIPSGKYTKTLSQLFLIQNSQKKINAVFVKVHLLVVAISFFPHLHPCCGHHFSIFDYQSQAFMAPKVRVFFCFTSITRARDCRGAAMHRRDLFPSEDFLLHNLWGHKFQFLWWIGLTPKFWC